MVTSAILGLISAWVIDGSFGAFVERLILGAQDVAMLKAGHTLAAIWRIDDFTLDHGEKIALAVMTGFVFLASLLGFSVWRVGRIGWAVLTITFAGAGIWIVAGLAIPQWASTRFRGLLFWAVPYGAWLCALIMVRGNVLRLISRRHLALVLCLVALPHVCAFGTNDNYWWEASMAAVFWVLAGLPFLAKSREEGISWRVALPVAAASLVITASVLSLSMEVPYRQPQPLRLQNEVVRIGTTGSELRVAHETAEYINKLRRLARSAGFRPGDPMLDMTGRSPGLLYAIGAKAIGRPWMHGGDPGSDDVTAATLDRMSRQELREAWILTEPTGRNKLSIHLLERYAINLEKNYIMVGRVMSPKGHYPDVYEQYLFKPAR